MTWRNRKLVDISREFLSSNGAKRTASVHIRGDRHGNNFPTPDPAPPVSAAGSHRDRWLAAVSALEAASQKGLSELFDSTIGGGTLLAPWGGRYALTPNHVAAARIPHLDYNTTTASLGSYGFFPGLSELSPFHGAYWSVVEAAARLVCAGGHRSSVRLSFQEYFPRLGDDPQRWGLPYGALLGAMEAQEALEAPAIGGKDSMSGSFEDLDVPPTLVAFSFCVADEEQIMGPELVPRESILAVVTPPAGPDGLPPEGALPEFLDLVESVVAGGIACAAGTIGETGVIPAVATAAMGNWCTLSLDEEALQEVDRRCGLERSSAVSVYLQIPTERAREAAKLLESPWTTVIGGVDSRDEGGTFPSDRWGPYGETLPGAITIAGEEIPLKDLRDAWMSPLDDVFPLPRGEAGDSDTSASRPPPGGARRHRTGGSTIAAPRVCIPVFPGTNCEYDSARAFQDAGALPVTPVFRKHSPAELSASIDELAQAIRRSQILMFPGGFSAGDEPDGSGKYIAAVFRDARLLDAVADLMTRRDGLILGICNGFQALVRMGLLPGGVDDLGKQPRIGLFLNAGLHHISTFAHTRVTATSSPWLAGTDPSRRYTVPISHGEGRLIASEEELQALRAGGQIATQYVEYNPNGSADAIEGITSPDGRILGKMAHNERVRPGLYRNLPDMAEMKIFENGVSWFR
jgi:phosphoribosylformylglycinamidine synthase